MFRSRLRTTLAVALAVALVTPSAHADDAAAADALFREGRKSFSTGNYARAAEVFAESQRLEPAPGTLLNLALAEEKLGRLAAAAEHARSVLAELPRADDRAKVAEELCRSLERRVARLTLSASNALPANATVTLDGAEVRSATFGVALPVDPGLHKIVVKARGHADFTAEVRLAEGQAASQPLTVGVHTAALVEPSEASPPAAASTASPLRTLGWVVASVGAASLATSGVFGAFAMQKNKTMDDHCQGHFCDQTGFDASRDGQTFATASTISFIGGATLVASGVLMLLFAPRSDRASTQAGASR